MKRKLSVWSAISIALLLCSVVVSLSLGSAQLPLSQVWRILFHHIPFAGNVITPDWPDYYEQIVMKVRFPRVVLAILTGAALSVAGAGFQGVLRNPLADPYTLGVASGASVGAAFVILHGLQAVLLGNWTIPVVAFCTGIVSLFLVLRLASVQGKLQTETVILSGVVIQAFLGSIVSFMVYLSDGVVNEVLFWLMGSLAFRGWEYSALLFPYLIIGLLLLLSYGRALNLFALGEQQASHLGVRVNQTKLAVLVIATLLTAAAVSVAGVIGFVGLITPHLVRLLVGPDYRLILPLSAVFGGIYMLWADTLARMLLNPSEIPLGVVTAFLGAPFFAYLLAKHKRSRRFQM